MEVSVKKPGSPEEVLAHFGKKGMRWGVRTKSTREFRAKNPTRRDRNQAIQRARFKVQTGKSSKSEEAVALRLKTGEKTVLGLMALTGIATVPIAAFVGINTAVRRSNEKAARKSS